MLVAAEGKHWDDVSLVRYPDFASLCRMIESADYRREAEPHRVAALADWRFIAITEMMMPS
ncbi:MAG: hypothetical protein ACRYF2_23300 [Janthinobacterium lividum]